MERKKICFVNLVNPNFLGGVSLYQKNIVDNLDKNKYDITWIYKSYKEEKYSKNGIHYVGLKVRKMLFIDDFSFNKKVKDYINKNYFDIINSHAICGYWLRNYKKKEGQKIIHTYHGLGVPYYKIQVQRYNFLKRIILSSILIPLGYITDRPPMKKADKIICVSDKVKKQVEQTYFKRKNIYVIRTGVELGKFKPLNKKEARKKIDLNPEITYGLYVGKGGYWIKGLDRAVKLCEEIYKLNKNFRLIVVGSERKKVGNLLDREFIIYMKEVDRNNIPLYYSASDFLLCLSRYEGGAPTLVVSEAMASGSIIVCSEDSEQEILKDNYNCLVIKKFDKESAKRIISIIENEKMKKNIMKNSINDIKKISLEEWSKQTLKVFFD